MKLIIDCEVAVLPFAIILYIYHCFFYTEDTVVNRRFRKVTRINIFLILGDIITSIGTNHTDVVPYAVNMAANSVFYILCSYLVYYVTMYGDAVIEAKTGRKKRWVICRIMPYLYIPVILVNAFTGFIFSFNESGYVHGPLYILGFLYICVQIVIFLVRVALNLDVFKRHNAVAMYTGFCLLLGGAVEQLFFSPDIPRSGLGSTVCIMAILLTMETPEYTELIELKRNYNEKLEKESEEQTIAALEVQNGILLGMTDLLAGRDPQMGGHVRRSSYIVKLIAEEMMKNPANNLQKSLLENTIKAAPLHDLGAIAMEDRITDGSGNCAQSDLTEIEAHVSSGGNILRSVLKDCPDKHLITTAINIATHHHERYDGKGYPDRLKGDEIPLEARIMTIADVFDNLMNDQRNSYQEAFDETVRCINEAFGTRFDPEIRQYFNACTPQIRQYYEKLSTEDTDFPTDMNTRIS